MTPAPLLTMQALALTASPVEMVEMDVMDCLAALEPLAGMEGMDRREILAHWVHLDPRDLLDHPMEG